MKRNSKTLDRRDGECLGWSGIYKWYGMGILFVSNWTIPVGKVGASVFLIEC